MTMEVKYNFFFQNWWSPHEHLGPWNTGVLQNEIIFFFIHCIVGFLCAALRGTCCLLKLETDNVTIGRRLFIYDYLQETQSVRKMFQLQVSWVLLQRTKVFTWTVATVFWWKYHLFTSILFCWSWMTRGQGSLKTFKLEACCHSNTNMFYTNR
jgi:hypothetical protein